MGIRRRPEKLMDEFYDEFEFQWVIFRAIKEAREKKGISQRDLAQKVGVTQSTIARLEAGRINPTLKFLKKVMLGLDLELTVKKIEPADPVL